MTDSRKGDPFRKNHWEPTISCEASWIAEIERPKNALPAGSINFALIRAMPAAGLRFLPQPWPPWLSWVILPFGNQSPSPEMAR